MIQSILFFLLGFLCAGFLALMVAPVIWRRAVNLTRKRVESSIPLTLSEIQAEKDALRAEFAMSIRRLEQKLQVTAEKASRQAVEIGRRQEDSKALTAQRDAAREKSASLEAEIARLTGRLEKSQQELAQTVERLSAARVRIDEQAQEIDKIGTLYDDASFAASSRQIELVARETEIEKLSGDIAVARSGRKEAERKMRETIAENRQLQGQADTTRRKIADLERKMARMITNLTNAEERLERREKELARLRRQARPAAGDNTQVDGQTEHSEDDSIEAQLAELQHENRQLRQLVQAGGDDEKLREQMHELAAEVVAMAARLEEPDSRISEMIDVLPSDDAGQGAISLAERIRALQHRVDAG